MWNYILNWFQPKKTCFLEVYQPAKPNGGELRVFPMAGRTLRCWGSALSFSGAIGTVGSVRLRWTGATLGESKIQLVSVAGIEKIVCICACVFFFGCDFLGGIFWKEHPPVTAQGKNRAVQSGNLAFQLEPWPSRTTMLPSVEDIENSWIFCISSVISSEIWILILGTKEGYLFEGGEIYETVITSGISFYIHRKIRFFHKFRNIADPNPNFTISWKLGRTSGELGL